MTQAPLIPDDSADANDGPGTVNPAAGFHILKDAWVTATYLRQYSEILRPHIATAAAATRMAATPYLRSVRGLTYLNLHAPDFNDMDRLTHLEDIYERGMFQRWSKLDAGASCPWHRILEYQVPVSDRRPSPLGLKAIDLLAVSSVGWPVVLELKVGSSGGSPDTPLRATLEAASYACVLQADWAAFRNELTDKLLSLGLPSTLPDDLDHWTLVVAAPADYWEFWNNPRRRTVVEAKPAFRELLRAFSECGFPIQLLALEGREEKDFSQLKVCPARFLDE